MGLLSALRPRRGGVLLAIRLFCAARPRAALGEKFNGREDFVRAGWRKRQFGAGEGPVHIRAHSAHVEVRGAVFI